MNKSQPHAGGPRRARATVGRFSRQLLGPLLCGLASGVVAEPVAPAPPLDPGTATWHIGLTDLFGQQKNRAIGLDCYIEFVNGQSTRGIGSARFYNKSLHPIRQTALVFNPQNHTLSGQLECVITPDVWVPADGQPFTVQVDVEGQLSTTNGQWRLAGSYRARRTDGQPLRAALKEASGPLAGGAGPTETGYNLATWKVQLTPVKPQGGLDGDTIEIQLGIQDGKVQWGRMGLTAEPPWPAARLYPIPTDGLVLDQDHLVSGTVLLDQRHLHPGGDPAQPVRMQLRLCRVQGLCSGEAVFQELKAGQPHGPATEAFGRGNINKGRPVQPQGLWMFERDERPWWTPVAGHQPVAPGEHPRLLFRKADLPALRQRAQTPEGAAILKRLRRLLDGKEGDTLPIIFSEVPPDNHGKSKPLPIGAFTSWHAAGYGLLHQLTGEAKYAELARQAVQLMFDGKYDIDNRYSWIKPGTDLRAGKLLAALAIAYDLCYDAWPAEFRQQVGREIQDYSKVACTGERVTIAHLVGRSKYPPGSNHYGSLIGTGTALLGILGDPGLDQDRIGRHLQEAEQNIPRMLELGFGDAGWFAEGFGASSALSRIPVLQFLWAQRVARGRDYLQPRPNAEWLSLFWVMHLGGTGLGHIPNRGVYQGDEYAFRDGDFAAGFANVSPAHLPALKWSYETFVASREPKAPSGEINHSWNATQNPLAAVMAYVAWPIGVAARNPAEILPKVAVDRVHGYFVARNRWQDADDIIVTHWLEYGPKGYYSSKDTKGLSRAGNVRVWGFGLRTGLETGILGGPVRHFAAEPDGSFQLTSGGAPAALLLDLGGASGAEAVVIALAQQLPKSSTAPTRNDKASTQVVDLKLGAWTVRVFTLQTAAAPKIVAVDERTLAVGSRQYRWDGQKLAATGK